MGETIQVTPTFMYEHIAQFVNECFAKDRTAVIKKNFWEDGGYKCQELYATKLPDHCFVIKEKAQNNKTEYEFYWEIINEKSPIYTCYEEA